MFNLILLKKQVYKFQRDGFIIFENVVNSDELKLLNNCCNKILDSPTTYNIFDWARTDNRAEISKFKIIQVGATKYFPELLKLNLFHWMRLVSSLLMEQPIDFWFDQFLIKPPRTNRATPWHQDEAYWGKDLANKAITCWIPLQDVTLENGCMCYASGLHKEKIKEHYHPKKLKSDLLVCKMNHYKNIQFCPIKAGSLIFHHCRTPHMATINKTLEWRKAISIHLKNPEIRGEGNSYAWRVYYDYKLDIFKKNTSPLKDTYF